METNRGGTRSGAGRPSNWLSGETVAIRVPVVIADKLLAIARKMDYSLAHPPERQNYFRVKLSTTFYNRCIRSTGLKSTKQKPRHWDEIFADLDDWLEIGEIAYGDREKQSVKRRQNRINAIKNLVKSQRR